MLTIDIDVARRFILGKQGLWPGRRWRGLAGTEQAMREIQYLQLDPLQIIARSHDIQLHSRVLNYKPGMWENITYQQRKFFDWGGWLATRPMDELPFWRVVMHRERDGHVDCDQRIHQNGTRYADVIEEVRGILRGRDSISNRDFKMAEQTRVHSSYRGRKESSLALYYLWRTGEVMTTRRENFERLYALTEKVAPSQFIYERSDEEVDRFLIKKEIAFSGLSRLQRTGGRGVPFGQKKRLCETLLAEGDIIEVRVEGWRATHYALAGDAEFLADLASGRVPSAWAPVDTTTTDEVVFLAPLDPVSARGRAKILFGFEYVWEVYKPRDKRQYGYYTLPILWADQLVARFDSRFDRANNTFIILGFWLEDSRLAKDAAFAEALANGLRRFIDFLGASKLDAKAIREPLLRQRVHGLHG